MSYIEKLMRKCRECKLEFEANRETFTQGSNNPATMVDPITGRGFKSLVSSPYGKLIHGRFGKDWLCTSCWELYSLQRQLKELEAKKKKVKWLKSRGFNNEEIKLELNQEKEDKQDGIL
jgi:hypothetical protein